MIKDRMNAPDAVSAQFLIPITTNLFKPIYQGLIRISAPQILFIQTA